MARIELRDVHVSFPIYTQHTRSLKTDVFTKLGGRLSALDNTVRVDALTGLSMTLVDGDRLGIIGHNGAGKTTLLRVMAGVYPPVTGTIQIDGSVSSFTDITLGMDPEATGWQNIIFRSVFLGHTFEQAREMSPHVAQFSELGSYLDVPVRTYSTGMFLRLAFAIATASVPDILIMDEMIAAGDAAFIEKAKARIDQLLARSRILVISSHDLALLSTVCNKILWLEKGKPVELGQPDEVLAMYRAAVSSAGQLA